MTPLFEAVSIMSAPQTVSTLHNKKQMTPNYNSLNHSKSVINADDMCHLMLIDRLMSLLLSLLLTSSDKVLPAKCKLY